MMALPYFKKLSGCILILLTLLIFSASVNAQEKTLYQRLGGYDALAAVTDDFLTSLQADANMSKFFGGLSANSMQRVRQLIVDQLCAATGGPCLYIGRDMKTAHQGMGITEADWNSAAKYLIATLDKFKVPQKEKDEVITAISSFKKDIVEKTMSN